MATIRPAIPDEVEQLQQLYHRALSNSFEYSPEMLPNRAFLEVKHRYFEKIISDPEALCLVAEQDNTLVAYITAARRDEPFYALRFMEVDNLGVLDGYRDQGIGQALMDRCVEWAKQRGYDKMYVTTFVGNAGARHFYGRNGFTDLEVGLVKDL